MSKQISQILLVLGLLFVSATIRNQVEKNDPSQSLAALISLQAPTVENNAYSPPNNSVNPLPASASIPIFNTPESPSLYPCSPTAGGILEEMDTTINQGQTRSFTADTAQLTIAREANTITITNATTGETKTTIIPANAQPLVYQETVVKAYGTQAAVAGTSAIIIDKDTGTQFLSLPLHSLFNTPIIPLNEPSQNKINSRFAAPAPQP